MQSIKWFILIQYICILYIYSYSATKTMKPEASWLVSVLGPSTSTRNKQTFKAFQKDHLAHGCPSPYLFYQLDPPQKKMISPPRHPATAGQQSRCRLSEMCFYCGTKNSVCFERWYTHKMSWNQEKGTPDRCKEDIGKNNCSWSSMNFDWWRL